MDAEQQQKLLILMEIIIEQRGTIADLERQIELLEAIIRAQGTHKPGEPTNEE